LHKSIEPLTLPLEPFACRYMSLKIKSADISASIEQARKTWTQLVPHRPFLYSFLNEDFDKQYQRDFNFKNLFSIFSSLAIFIACLGLLGLATYTTEIRTKEIGIRKVLGANVSSIVTLLSKDFLILVIVAMVLATPIAWYSMNKWLEGFAYRVETPIWIFLLSGIFAMTAAVTIISFQTVKTAMANPVNSLKSE
jgi:putative ABC transport system permease protein